ncbi:hypothetical protein [Parendozoicomonas sp. Alg238-R29]|uniref:hypothetical protein n=1 Tax=Parendozoicomonas sp. Alg238-R29 TaxID=2993446 RepID=UPI00248EF834|nr:hypothetical protein [Parendozoicomonas sp. Alg238-R29]
MAIGKLDVGTLVQNLTQLEAAHGDISRLKFGHDAQGRVVVEATPNRSTWRFLVNFLFCRKASNILYAQAKQAMQSTKSDTPLKERIIRDLQKGVFPFHRPEERVSFHKGDSEEYSMVELQSQIRAKGEGVSYHRDLPEDEAVNLFHSEDRTGGSEIEKTEFSPGSGATNQSDIDFTTLRNALPGKTEDNEILHNRFNTYVKVLESIDDHKDILNDEKLTLKEKQSKLLDKSGIFFHLTREPNPTSPGAAVRALDGIAYMMGELAKPENADKRQEALIAVLSSEKPCHEAQITHAQIEFARVIDGVVIPEDEDNTLQDHSLDTHETLEVNFQKLVLEYSVICADTGTEQTVEAFTEWARELDGVVNFQAKDGVISLKTIQEYAEIARDVWCVLE